MADDINSTPDLSSMLGELFANKELMEKIGELADSIKSDEQSAKKDTPPQPPTIDSLLSNPDIMSKLPDVINVIKPLMSGESTQHSHDENKRLALLMALKPYLSPRRCEAIDYIARMSKLSQTVKGLKL